MVTLRNMIESDIEDNVRWFSTEVEWMNWDAPWEENVVDEEKDRKEWTEIYEQVKDLTLDQRGRLEIDVDGVHVGWVCSYYDLDYIENSANIIAIGIDIPDQSQRGKGIGTEALKKYMMYLYLLGHEKVLIQTWSGNERMIKLIEKLGFKEYIRLEKIRTVRGKQYDAITYIKELL